MPDKIARRKHFIINAAYTTILTLIVGIVLLSSKLLLPFWTALLLAALMQPLTRFLGRKIHIKKNFYQHLSACFFI